LLVLALLEVVNEAPVLSNQVQLTDEKTNAEGANQDVNHRAQRRECEAADF